VAVDLNEMVVFAKVVETGSFTAAAAALDLPKSTISRKVAQLEERLDARLLQRTTRKLSLTEIGRAYYERCQRIVADIAAAEALVGELQAAPRGLLRITAPVDFGELYLGEIIAEFLAQTPEITIEAVIVDRLMDLVDERVDLALRFGPLPDSTLVARRLCAMKLVPCAAPSYLAHAPPLDHPDQLADHQVVAYVPSTRMRSWSLRREDEEVDVMPTPRVAVNVLGAALDAARAGAGVTLLPDFAVTRDLRAGALVRVLPDWCGYQGEIFAVYPSTRNASPKLRAFLDFVSAKLDPAPWA
jgi:DNA-binding transcriptional LysR family regulator